MSEAIDLTREGLNLLTGEGGTFAPEEGVQRLQAASTAGGAEAAAHLATLAAMGVGAPQDLRKAFDLLALAAERGAVRAQGQLRLLAADPHGADWRDLARRIEPAPWLAPPPKEIVCEAPRIRWFRGFLPPPACAWLIAVGKGRAIPAGVYDPETGRPRLAAGRSNSAFELSLADLDVVSMLVRAKMSAASGVPVPALEPPQLLHYAPGQRFERHHDYLDTRQAGLARDAAEKGQRIATLLIYLNDDYEGGETEFPLANLSLRGAPGDALMFANVDRSGSPDPLTLHRGAPPTSGEKWLLSQWMRDRTLTAG